jgi:hypothetical protein
VFVLMAGPQRLVVPGSRVAVHAPGAVLVGGGQRVVLSGALLSAAVRGAEPVLRTYARWMGVDPAVVLLAHRVPNWSSLTLTSAELSRYRLVTGRAAPARKPGSRARSAGL